MSKFVRFGRRRDGVLQRRRNVVLSLAIPLLIVAAAGGYAANPGSTAPVAGEHRVAFEMCGRVRETCVVDGDTIWFEGRNLRMQSYDTPEPYDGICGGQREVALAKKASARLLALLNGNPFTIETFGLDGTGKRTLATIRIAGRDVGDILVEEKLARRWPDGAEWWCDR